MHSWSRIATTVLAVCAVAWLVARNPPPAEAPVAVPNAAPASASPNAPGLEPPASRPPAPPFSLPDVEGHPVSLATFQGKKIVVASFFATWCEPCGMEAPELQSLSWKYRTQPVQFLLLSTDDPGADVSGFAQAHGVTFPVLTGADAIEGAYGVTDLPCLIIIDKAGRIAFTRVGFVPDGLASLQAAIDAALRERLPGKASP